MSIMIHDFFYCVLICIYLVLFCTYYFVNFILPFIYINKLVTVILSLKFDDPLLFIYICNVWLFFISLHSISLLRVLSSKTRDVNIYDNFPVFFSRSHFYQCNWLTQKSPGTFTGSSPIGRERLTAGITRTITVPLNRTYFFGKICDVSWMLFL